MPEPTNNRPALSAKCPHCGSAIKFYVPQQPGTLKFKCPKCGGTFGVKITEAMLKQNAKNTPAGTGANATDKKSNATGNKSNAKDTKPAAAGVAADNKQSVPKTDDIDNINSSVNGSTMARVVMFRPKMLLFTERKEFALRLGANVIGRADSSAPSDIAPGHDTTISRRSVAITVEAAGGGYRYWFEVLNATNPVMVDGKAHSVGESFEIEPGTTFVLGRTKFRLE